MRRYRLYCIDCKATLAVAPETVWCEHVVTVLGGLPDACDKARSDGYWPVSVIESDWA